MALYCGVATTIAARAESHAERKFRRGLVEVNSMTLFAASSWPFGLLLALPVIGVLLFMVVKFARNPRQRLAYLLIGTLGAIAGLAAFLVYLEHADRRFDNFIPVAAAGAMMIGSAIGVVISARIRSGIAVLPGKGRWWQMDIADIRPKVLAIVFLLGILQYWAIGLLCVYGYICESQVPFGVALAFASYFTHWSSVGGLIGFAVSRNRRRGGFIGAGIGLILSAALMT